MVPVRVSRRTRLAGVAAFALLLLALVVDRASARLGAVAASHRLACVAGLTESPTVALHGFPFLTQVASDRYADVDVVARDVRRGELTATAVHANLYGVSPHSADGVRAEHVSVDATVPYSVLPGEVAGRRLTYGAAGGLLAISTTAAVARHEVPVTILAELEVRDGAVTIKPRGVQVLGVRTVGAGVPAGIPDLGRQLPALPAQLRYESLTAAEDGLHVRLGGDDITAPFNADSCGSLP